MKQQDIDKKIGMPDVDKEWARFEHEVIAQKTTSRKSLYWGIGIAASIALVTGIFLLNHNAEKQQAIAQQTTNTTESLCLRRMSRSGWRLSSGRGQNC